MRRIYNNEFYEINKPVGIEIKDKNELNEDELKLLELAQLNDFQLLEAWTALGTNQELAYSTHSFFRYFGKFPPVIATHLITTYTCENDIVFDPMCGSGTTGIEAIYLNRNAFLNDINPLSVLLSKVKTTHIDRKILEDTLSNIQANYKPLTISKYHFEPIGLQDYHHWFLKETCNSLRGLKKLIEEIEDINVKNFFLANFCSIIRPVSRATTQQGRLFLDVETAQKNALDSFVKKCTKNIDSIDKLPAYNHISISSKDIKEDTFDEISNCAKLIILHPPYFNSYRYSSVNSLELSWLGINQKDVRKDEIHEFFKVGKAEKVMKYVEDMLQSIRNIQNYLSADGRIAIMIGDTIIKEEYIPVTKLLLEQLEENSNLAVEKVILRVPKYTEASWAASQRRNSDAIGINLNDFIIILKER